MKLDRVTLTGADDSVKVQDLVALSERYPFVEFGILFSQNHQGRPRFPSLEWLGTLEKTRAVSPMRLCAHLCGKWVRDIAIDGKNTFAQDHPELWEIFDRVQLNFHAHKHDVHPNLGAIIGPSGKQFILQMDGANDDLFVSLRLKGGIVNIVPLFDASGGAGVLAKNWPMAFGGIYNGYAGGLGPENVREQLWEIQKVAGNSVTWIDMETKIRSDDDRTFMLDKCERVLQLCESYVEPQFRRVT